MKLLIASDIHGSAYWCEKLLALVRQEQPDKLVLLGDVLYHGPRNDLPREYAPKQVIAMLSQWADKILCVRGNCEAEVDQMVLPFPCLADYAIVLDGGITFYLTHGHHANPDNLPALEQGSIFLSGHTHVKMDEVRNGIRCVNPGSVSIPKDGTNSCMVWENGVLRTVIWEE
jgi:putative phosphoesterase